MAGVGEWHVGAVLIVCGLAVARTRRRPAAPLNRFVGALPVLAPAHQISTSSGKPDTIPGASGIDLRRDMADAAATAACPACDRPARRRCSVGVGRPPTDALRDAGRADRARADRARADRARSGEPIVTGPPSGRRMPRLGGHRH